MNNERETRDEAAMIASILAGETQLYHELIRPHERSVYLMALTFLKNEGDAEDVAQEAFLKAYRNLASFRAEAKFSTWLISITLNEARSRLRKQASVRVDSLDELIDGGDRVAPALLRDWHEIPSEVIERSEVRYLLQQAVADLPEIYRSVFLLREVQEMSVAQTAEALQISVPSVKVRLHRARMMLQRQLTPALRAATSKPKRRWLPWS
jgi:RNA polymerase sigma-70 factor (ECF subfamily)